MDFIIFMANAATFVGVLSGLLTGCIGFFLCEESEGVRTSVAFIIASIIVGLTLLP